MSDATEFHRDDADDVAASLAGDQDAFGRIVERHQQTIAAQMRRFSRDPVIGNALHSLIRAASPRRIRAVAPQI